MRFSSCWPCWLFTCRLTSMVIGFSYVSTGIHVHNRSVVYKSRKDIMPASCSSCRSAMRHLTCKSSFDDLLTVRRAALRFRHLAEFAAHKTPSNALQVAFNPYQRPPNERYGHHDSMFAYQSGRMTCGKIISPAGVSVVMVARWSIVLIRQSIASMML